MIGVRVGFSVVGGDVKGNGGSVGSGVFGILAIVGESVLAIVGTDD